MLEFSKWLVIHLGAWSLMLLCAGGLGGLFLRKHRFDSLVERLVFTLALGLGLSALFIFALGIAGLLYPKVLLVLTVTGGQPRAPGPFA